MDITTLFTGFYPAVIIFCVLLILHALFIKKTRLLVNVIAVYLTTFFSLIFISFLSAGVISDDVIIYFLSPWKLAVLFLICVLCIHLLLNFTVIAHFSSRVAPSRLSTSLLYRVAIVGLFVAVMTQFSGFAESPVFMSPFGPLFWLVFSLLCIFAYRFRTGSGEWVE